MARPARKVEDPNIEGQDDTDTQALDEASQEGQSTRTGQVGEADDDFISALAKRAGHTSKEEWKRDPAKWVDERTYLERLPEEVKTLQERNRRTAQAAADAIEDSRRQARIDAHKELTEAFEKQDPEQFNRATERLDKTEGPPPVVAAWIARNGWFNLDPAARMLAGSVTERLAKAGASMSEQLAAAEEEVRKRYPEHFGQAEPHEDREVPLRESRHIANPPAIQAGTRGGDTRTREKGFGDMAPGDRAIFAKTFLKTYVASGLSREQAEARYAKSYWRNQGEA